MPDHLNPGPMPPPVRERLQDCTSCGTPFMEPVSLLGVFEDRLVVAMRCGNCDSGEVVTASERAFEALDDDLDKAEAAIRDDIRMMDLAAAEDEFSRFLAALYADAVLPEDF